MSSSLTPVRHEFLAFRYVFCNSGSQPAEPKSRSAPVALQACQTACACHHYAELTPNGPPLTNSSLVGPGKFVFPISDTSLGAISPDPSNRPVETKPTTSARPVAGQTAPCLSREAWQAWWSGRRRKPPDLSPMPPAVGSQPRLFRAPQKPILRINKKQHHESRLCPLHCHSGGQNGCSGLFRGHSGAQSGCSGLLCCCSDAQNDVQSHIQGSCSKKLCSVTLDSVAQHSALLCSVHGYARVHTSIYIYIYIWEFLF